MKKYILLLVIIIFPIFIYSQNKNTISGEAGYILNISRLRNGLEGVIQGYKYCDPNLPEEKRWLANQLVYMDLKYRYTNLIEFGGGLSLYINDKNNNNLLTVLPQLYLKYTPIDWVSFNFGKQRLKWGTSNIFHPIDKLETQADTFDLHLLVEGLGGIRATFIPTDWFSISVLALPDYEIRWTKAALRFDFVAWDIDIGFGGIKYDYKQIKSITSDTPEIERLDRGAAFFDIIRYFGNVGLYGEFEFRFSREKQYGFIDNSGTYQVTREAFAAQPVFRVSTGITYKMDKKPYLNLVCEYFFNSDGFDQNEAKSFYAKYKYHRDNYSSKQMVLWQGFGKFTNFRQHYLYIGVSNIEVVDFMAFNASVISNLETLSFDFSAGITFNLNKLIYINLKYEYLHQFLDMDEYPSDLNFINDNHKITLSVSTSYSNL